MPSAAFVEPKQPSTSIDLAPHALAPYEQALRGNALVLFDGLCSLCNNTIRFVMSRDRDRRLFYAPLDSALARTMLARHPALPQTPEAADSVVVILDALTARESALLRSDAVLAGMTLLPAPWPALARVLRLIPRPLRNLGYRIVARLRFRLFGRYATCPIPTPAERTHILAA